MTPHDEALTFRTRMLEAHQAVAQARAWEAQTAKVHREATQARKEAERRLAALLEAEVRDCPLLDWAAENQPSCPPIASLEETLAAGAELDEQEAESAEWRPINKEEMFAAAERAASALDAPPPAPRTIPVARVCELHACPGGRGPWRGQGVALEFPGYLAGPLKKAGLTTLGQLADHLAGCSDPSLSVAALTLIRGLSEERARQAVDCFRSIWAEGTEEGRRGEFPVWLGKPESTPPPHPEKPYGYDLLVAFNDGTEKECHYAGSETTTRRKAMLQSGAKDVLKVTPLTREAYERAYGRRRGR